MNWGLASREEARGALRWVHSASEDEIRDLRRRWSSASDGLHRRAYLEAIGFARDALEAKGATDLPSYP